MANPEESNTPVPVIVTNIVDPKQSLEKIRKESENTYKLLNGKDYKEVIKNLSKKQDAIAIKTQSIEKLLGDIKTSLTTIKPTSTTQAYTQTQSQASNQDNSNKSSSSQDDKVWRDNVYSSLVSIENEVVGTKKQEKNVEFLIEGINKLVEEGKLNEEVSKSIKELSHNYKEQSEKQKRNLERAQEETAAERESSERALDAIKNAVEEGNELTESEEESIKRAQGAIDEIKDHTSNFSDSIKRVKDDLKNLLSSNFRKVFDTWDRQIATLKEQGMGGPNAAMLNKMTRRTMDATEQTLGWNVSIEKAIKATNAMIAAGQSPRYLRENNKQLITGLEGVGFNLQPFTIRAIGQSVFDSSQVKDLAQGWAELSSPDTEGAISKDQISSFLESDDFKKATAAMMMDGTTTYAEIQKEMIAQLKEAVKAGVTGPDALAMALTSTQNNLGRGAVVVVPDRLSSYIGAAQIAGTYSGNVGNLTADFAAATRKYHSDANVRQRMSEASASLAQSGDYSLLENIQFNDGHIRRIATKQDIEEGQYEGLVPRITKAVAGLLPAESLGSVSQQLTGDSGFLTKQAFELGGGLLKDSPQIFYLKKIASNTEKEANGTGEKGKSMSKFFKGALPLMAGLAVTAGLMYTAYSDSQAEEKAAEEARQRALESFAKEMELEKQQRDALLNGNKKLADDIDKQLREARDRTNQELSSEITLKEGSSDDLWKMGGAGIGGALGAALAVGLGFLLAPTTGGLSLAAGLGLAGAGLAGGAALGYGGTALATGASGPNMSSEVSSARSELAQSYAAEQAKKNKYAEGGIITKEQVATVGEGDKPEAIIPLTNPEKAKEVMDQAANMSSTNPEVASMMSQEPNQSQGSLADLIVKAAESVIGVPYVAGNLKHPEKGLVCNQVVEYAYAKAGVPLKSGGVSRQYAGENPWIFTETPQPGFAIFNNWGLNKYGKVVYQHMGVVGHNNSRIHASQKWGRVVKNPDLYGKTTWKSPEDGMGIEFNNPKKYSREPIFAYLSGIDYGSAVDMSKVKQIDLSSLPSVSDSGFGDMSQPTPNSRGIISVNGEERHVINSDTMSKVDTRRIFNESVQNAKLKYTDFNPQVLTDLLLAKSRDMSPDFDAKIAAHNPFGILNIDGSLKEYDDVESGIQAFISKLEAAYDKLESMDYEKQLDALKERHLISGYDYDRTMSVRQDRLANALDKLNSSVEESNRIAMKATINKNAMPISSLAGRRY